ncbi:MAG: hypothetical protein LBC94_08890 [Desulfovibrio sp.]|jgi:hypothetical protein|nr:hypothetical protein [Desulfovibrio sp.]
MNDWEDANCYFSVGKSIINGAVLYKDIIEQKGPLIYFIHGISSIISERGFFGVYIIEIIAAASYLYFTCKIFLLYMYKRIAHALLLFSAIVTYTSFSFQHGDSAEELCLPFIAYGVYKISMYFRSGGGGLPRSVFFINGILAGCVLWIKFTMLGFYIGLMLTLLAYYIHKKFIKDFIYGVSLFLFGIFVATIPFAAYFISNDAFDSVLSVYFYDNIFRYAEISSALAPLYNPLLFFARCSWYNDFMPCVLSLGCLYSFFSSESRLSSFEKFHYAMSIIFTLFGQGIGGKFYQSYYFLPIIPLLLYAASPCIIRLREKLNAYPIHTVYQALFIAIVFSVAHYIFEINLSNMMHSMTFRTLQKIFGLGAALGLLALALNVEGLLKNSMPIWKKLTGIVFACVVFSFLLSQNTYLLCVPKNRLPQYRFAEIINQIPKATLLNYDFLDGGFYTAAGIVPNTKYFCRLNLNAPEMLKEQRRLVEEGVYDFVVCRSEEDATAPFFVMYRLLATSKFDYENHRYIYFLLGRRDIFKGGRSGRLR